MADLRIKDLVVEYASGQETVRPIDGLNLYLNNVLVPSGTAIMPGTTTISFEATSGDQVYLRAYNGLGYVQSDDAFVP